MARKRIQTTIPDWFNLTNYGECENFTAKDWAHCLHFRYDILTSLRNFGPRNNTIKLSFIKEKFYRRMKENPTNTEIGNHLAFDIPFRNFLPSETGKSLDGLTYSHLSSLTMLDASNIHDDFASDSGGKFKHIVDSGPIDDKEINLDDLLCHHFFDASCHDIKINSDEENQYEDFLGEPYDDISNSPEDEQDTNERFRNLRKNHLVVNLTVADDTLKAQFANWLKVARKKYKYEEVKTISKDGMKKLNDNRILPFIDIEIWRILTRTYMPLREIFELLYSNKIHTPGAQDKFVKSVFKQANTCLTSTYINALLHNN